MKELDIKALERVGGGFGDDRDVFGMLRKILNIDCF